MNRMEQWWREVQQWKGRFENLFRSMGIHPDRSFLKEELRMYDRILSKPMRDMTSEERLTKRIIGAEQRKLIRQLYPNPVLRLGRQVFRLGSTLARHSLSRIVPNRAAIERAHALERLGFPEGKQNGEPLSSQVHSESISPGEVMDYKIKFMESPGGKPVIKGYEASLTDARGKNERIFISADMGIDKYRAAELLHGRSVHKGGSQWIVPDPNDRDQEGGVKLRVISFPGYDVGKQLAEIPGMALRGTRFEQSVSDLMDGKRVEIPIKIKGTAKNIGIEANPLKRDFMYYQEGKKVTPDKLAVTPATKVLKMNTAPKQSRQRLKV